MLTDGDQSAEVSVSPVVELNTQPRFQLNVRHDGPSFQDVFKEQPNFGRTVPLSLDLLGEGADLTLRRCRALHRVTGGVVRGRHQLSRSISDFYGHRRQVDEEGGDTGTRRKFPLHQSLPCLNRRHIVRVVDGSVSALPDERLEMKEHKSDAGGLSLTGRPVLLELIQDNREIAAQQLDLLAVNDPDNLQPSANSTAVLTIVRVGVKLIIGLWNMNAADVSCSQLGLLELPEIVVGPLDPLSRSTASNQLLQFMENYGVLGDAFCELFEGTQKAPESVDS